MNAPEQDILNHLADCHNMVLTSAEVLEAIKIKRLRRSMKHKAIHHTCGNPRCLDSRCMVLVDIREHA